jgi:hypothetical protein
MRLGTLPGLPIAKMRLGISPICATRAADCEQGSEVHGGSVSWKGLWPSDDKLLLDSCAASLLVVKCRCDIFVKAWRMHSSYAPEADTACDSHDVLTEEPAERGAAGNLRSHRRQRSVPLVS